MRMESERKREQGKGKMMKSRNVVGRRAGEGNTSFVSVLRFEWK